MLLIKHLTVVAFETYLGVSAKRFCDEMVMC